jgi:cold shock CspA family protein
MKEKSGVVAFYDPQKRWGVIETDRGKYFTHQRFIEYDGMARRILYQNELVEFFTSDKPPQRGALPIAEMVRSTQRPEETISADHREFGKVMSVICGHHGYIARDCDDSIFFYVADVLTLGLEVGARVFFGIAKDEKGFRAVDIEVFLPDE